VYQDGSNDKGDAATNVKAVKDHSKIESYVANYCTKKDTFKKKYSEKENRTIYVQSESCELNSHYYMKENYRQVECSDGTVREYKRRIEGRLWNASYNLNVQSAWLSNIHEPYNDMIKLFEDTSVIKTLDCDYAKVHIYKKPIFKHLPNDVKRVFKEARAELRKHDIIQTRLEIETIY